ncbi:hypothetical protein CAPTEDRAFT_190819 [Capitella teleta]|uniref:Chitin-binding type-2 domain-containing protein n=1 Tax=Capitella teleta TaxID=283909 RepID=R7VGB0_CAPTE|nr:hypothetical protein CAPTEDRAFT_190819 [Capitella teleta]|eukprot:ELU17883.1 hypothetical protein CAPTEDRAFT_190819 [Capitella teleta]
MAFVKFLVVIPFLVLGVQSQTDPCNRQMDCFTLEEKVADPDDCKKYYMCYNFMCELQAMVFGKFLVVIPFLVLGVQSQTDPCNRHMDCFTQEEKVAEATTYVSMDTTEGTQTMTEQPISEATEHHSDTSVATGYSTWSFISSTFADQTTNTPLDPCNRDWFCVEGQLLPDPDSCLHYFYCAGGQWGRIKCPRGYLFDWNSAYCRDEGVICHPQCSPKPTPIEPGVCEAVMQCEIGEKFPDRASCIHFWECIESEGILERKLCGAQFPTYVFDLALKECVKPEPLFDCDSRCLS